MTAASRRPFLRRGVESTCSLCPAGSVPATRFLKLESRKRCNNCFIQELWERGMGPSPGRSPDSSIHRKANYVALPSLTLLLLSLLPKYTNMGPLKKLHGSHPGLFAKPCKTAAVLFAQENCCSLDVLFFSLPHHVTGA
ncbi:hypothetical protein COCON_G00168140 [Conger conger]|uniref:Uncharacterized protein n=1 Tax=Conger conger TaxID=82655 RepID=A0A9Q1D7D7_CONCO|nr:hypothetical protein COCON_G00168140 [Conger conger]